MRAIFLILISLNAALLAWQLGFGTRGDFDSEAGSLSALAFDNADEVGGTLLLLAESSPEVRPTKEAPQAVELCKIVGPFDSDLSANTFIERLAALDVAAVIHPIVASVEEGYRVYLPPESGRDAAKRALAMLQSRGFDSYIIPKGELENGIALGVFKKRSSADARVAELRALNYKPLIQVIGSQSQEIWVILNRGERKKISDASWLALVGGSFTVQEKENLCLDVASH